MKFTLPANSCSDYKIAGGEGYGESGVSFTAQQPRMTSNAGNVEDIVDFWVDCNASGGADFQFKVGDQAAPVSGHPNAAVCYQAVSRQPVSSSLPFTPLRHGTQLCIIAASSGGAPGQLAWITLVSKDPTTFDTSWTATG